MFDYENFKSQVHEKKNSYNNESPFPYALFDGLFDDELLSLVNDEINLGNFHKDVRSIDKEEVKTRSDFEDNEDVPPMVRKVFDILNGGKFLNLISQLTEIEGLISDPYFDGGGVNIIGNGGKLAVHVDGTTHHRMKVCRRLNAILFLNEYWDPSWRGFHEQWDFKNKELSPIDRNQEWRCVRKILPKKNRLLVFTTNDYSWHGHAGALKVPDGVTRNSLIAYFYTSKRPDKDFIFENPHRAFFIDNSKTLISNAFDDCEIVL